jgi:hypothetical protein
MIWTLRFSNKHEASIVRHEDNRMISGTIDWMTASNIVMEHNREIDQLLGERAAQAATRAVEQLKKGKFDV